MYQTEALEDYEEARPNKCRTCLYYTWKVITCIFSHIILVSLVVAYCILGAFTFSQLEKGNELKVKREISVARKDVLDELWSMTKNSDVLNQENYTMEVHQRLKDFEMTLLDYMKKKGWDGTEDEDNVQWTFAGALFYSIIVITTIGYGHIAPKTPEGKVVTIFYAILGIPLMLLCLSNIGDIMAHSFRFLYWRVCCFMCTRKPKRPPSRRGRSVRGTVRSSSGSRYSSRSRQQTFRQPGMRTSTRSADSALGLSESMTRSSYSDTECRYNDDNEMTIDPGEQFRASQHSRYSDTAVPLRTGEIITPTSSVRSKNEGGRADVVRTGNYEGPEPQIPVLFNKYALDREESMRAQRPGKFLNRSSATLPRQQHQHYYPNPQYQSSPYGGSLKRKGEMDRLELQTPPLQPNFSRSSKKGQPSSSSRMSPMGFPVPRQNYKPSGLGRLREDMDYDYEYDDYELDNYSGSQSAKTKPVPIWLCVFLVVSYIFGGAFLFYKWEKNWEFLDSAYFCFITLTTIGFGDFVPAQNVKADDVVEISIALCSLYLLFGIALLAMSFNLVQEEVINNVKSVAKRLGIIKEDEEDEEE